MTREELLNALSFIVYKCDKIINSKNYTADDYVQDNVEDIAELCNKILDGDYGEIIEDTLELAQEKKTNMKAPDKIYIQPNAHDGWFEGNKPNDNFVEYICKDALLEWLDGKMTIEGATEGYVGGYDLALKDVINKIESQ